MTYQVAQTFYVDKDSVKGAGAIGLSSLVLFVKGKPLPQNNKTGIANPGLALSISKCKSDGTPDINNILPNSTTQKEYNEIVASGDGSGETKFVFDKPVILVPGNYYAFLVSSDGSDDFTYWVNTEGDNLIGSSQLSQGATSKFVGNFYEFSSYATKYNSVSSGTTQQPTTQGADDSTWKPLKHVDMKFRINIAVYANVDPTSVVANTTNANTANVTQYAYSYLLPNDPIEFMVYDKYGFSSSNAASTMSRLVGKRFYQDTPVSYGTLTVQAANNIVLASNNVNFNNLFNLDAVGNPLIVIKDPVSGSTVIRKILDVQSNTQIMLQGVTGFNSNTATFSICPVAELLEVDPYTYQGNWWTQANNTNTYWNNKFLNVAILKNTTANSSVRFVNNHITGGVITANGTGYSNTDFVIITCGVAGSLNATANVVTSNTGALAALAFANAGYGMTNNISYSIKAANGAASNGSGAVLTFTNGQNIKSESQYGAVFSNVVFDNFEAHLLTPHLTLIGSTSTAVRINEHFSYYVFAGAENTLLKDPVATAIQIGGGAQATPTQQNDGRIWVIPSRSNDVLFANTVIVKTDPMTGVTSNTDIGDTSGLVTEYVATSNNAFEAPVIAVPDFHLYEYSVNNDITNETKTNGKALAKYISSKITLAAGKFAEDIRVVVTSWRPANTNLKVYAKIFNSQDTDTYAQKDWTELNLISGNANTFSSISNPNDIIEYQFGFKTNPNTFFTSSSLVTTTLASANINTTNTTTGTFTTDFQVSDIVKIYPPLFPDNFQVGVVGSITNTTQLILKSPIANNNLVGSGLKIELVGRLANGANAEVGRPMQAFINPLNDNVVRYYNTAGQEIDNFDSFAIKVVMLSNTRSVVPKLDSLTAIGVSA